jgi:hypothetical protein
MQVIKLNLMVGCFRKPAGAASGSASKSGKQPCHEQALHQEGASIAKDEYILEDYRQRESSKPKTGVNARVFEKA